MSMIIMKFCLCFIFVVFVGVCPAVAQNNSQDEYRHLEGSYQIVGRWPDSDQPYTGRATITRSKERLRVVREVGNEVIEAVGSLVTVTPDHVPVLRINFNLGKEKFEQTCLISSDLDNYPRLTCYQYGSSTTKVGLEAMFSDHGQLQKK